MHMPSNRFDHPSRRKAVVMGLSRLLLPFAARSQARTGQPRRSEESDLRLLRRLDRSYGGQWIPGPGARRRQLGDARAPGHRKVERQLPHRAGCRVRDRRACAGGRCRAPAQRCPIAVGLAVPGMPVGSPGMEGPAYAGRQDPDHVLLIATDASASAFQSHH